MVTVIGLEIHAELLTKTKIFCSCENSFGGKPNERVCPICAGFPGTMPSFNKEAAILAVKAGKALGFKINNYSAFDRKNYFYPDLPKAYQITQYEYPICTEGSVSVGKKSFGITRIHMEEDAGKLIHTESGSQADFNRCGVPLIEIVTEPDFENGDEVCSFVEEIALRLKYCGVCDARLEQGSLRVDVNISVKEENCQTLGTRTEIKNLNSYKAIKKAIAYEAARQEKILHSGGSIMRETLRFDGEKTYSMRSKESAEDYRYFPEPDIPPIFISDEEIEEITIPRLPGERINEYTKNHGLSDSDAKLIVQDREFSDIYEKSAEIYPDYSETTKLMLGAYSRELNKNRENKITAQIIAETVRLISEGKISKNSANEILSESAVTGGNPQEIAEKHGMLMQDNTQMITEAANKIIAENPKAVSDYKSGNKKSFGFLMGKLMTLAGKSANPKTAKDILSELLN